MFGGVCGWRCILRVGSRDSLSVVAFAPQRVIYVECQVGFNELLARLWLNICLMLCNSYISFFKVIERFKWQAEKLSAFLAMYIAHAVSPQTRKRIT